MLHPPPWLVTSLVSDSLVGSVGRCIILMELEGDVKASVAAGRETAAASVAGENRFGVFIAAF